MHVGEYYNLGGTATYYKLLGKVKSLLGITGVVVRSTGTLLDYRIFTLGCYTELLLLNKFGQSTYYQVHVTVYWY